MMNVERLKISMLFDEDLKIDVELVDDRHIDGRKSNLIQEADQKVP